MPPENFDPEVEADVLAYFEVIPNWPLGTRWYSKERFGRVYWNGAPMAMRRGEVWTGEPYSGPEQTWDPVDWDVLQPEYERVRARLLREGYDEVRAGEYAMKQMPRWMGVFRRKEPPWVR